MFKIGLELKLGPPHANGEPAFPPASQRKVLSYDSFNRVHDVTALNYPAHESTLTEPYHVDAEPARLAKETSGMSSLSLWGS